MCDASAMRTTLTLDDDVLEAARAIATARGVSIGEIISELARASLTPSADVRQVRNGVPLFPVRPGAGQVTPDVVRALLDETR